MKIKVCGMREPKNIHLAEQTGVDLMGFIFYSGSSRFVGSMEPVGTRSVERVGVFANEDFENVMDTAGRWNLQIVQLHGDESPEYCALFAGSGLQVVKAFGVGEDFDFTILESYVVVVDYFLFDTRGSNYGGTGRRFDWEILRGYHFQVPFWLSGGIRPGSAAEISALSLPRLEVVDVNSGFEDRPGFKNIEKLKTFVDELQDR